MIELSSPQSEAFVFNELPNILKIATDRSEFIDELKKREEQFSMKIAPLLQSVFTSKEDLMVLVKGDWHFSGCTSLVTTKLMNRKCMLKFRSSEAEQLLQSILESVQSEIKYPIYVPKITINSGDKWFIQDYVHKDSANEAFPEYIGALLAIAFWLGLSDLHNDNIMVSGNGLAIIDGECIFHGHRGLKFQDRIKNTGLFYANSLKTKSGYCVLHKAFDVTGVIKGWKHTMKWLYDHKATLIDYQCLDEIPFRRVFLHTSIYFKFLQSRFVYGWNLKETERRWKKIRSHQIVSEEIVSEEVKFLSLWLIPYFYQKGSYFFSEIGHRPILQDINSSERYRRFHNKVMQKPIIELTNELKMYLKKWDKLMSEFLKMKERSAGYHNN